MHGRRTDGVSRRRSGPRNWRQLVSRLPYELRQQVFSRYQQRLARSRATWNSPENVRRRRLMRSGTRGPYNRRR